MAPKEDRSGWVRRLLSRPRAVRWHMISARARARAQVAVESEFQGTAAAQIKPAMSAFQFFQRENMKGRGEAFDLGAVMREVSAKWRELDERARAPFEEAAARDRERYDAEAAARDEEAIAEQEARRLANTSMAAEGKRERKPEQEVRPAAAPRPKRELSAEEAAAKAERVRQTKERNANICLLYTSPSPRDA